MNRQVADRLNASTLTAGRVLDIGLVFVFCGVWWLIARATGRLNESSVKAGRGMRA